MVTRMKLDLAEGIVTETNSNTNIKDKCWCHKYREERAANLRWRAFPRVYLFNFTENLSRYLSMFVGSMMATIFKTWYLASINPLQPREHI
jgi:hypothetical protein